MPVCHGAAGGGNYAAAWRLPDSLLRPQPEPAAPARAPTRALLACPVAEAMHKQSDSMVAIEKWRTSVMAISSFTGFLVATGFTIAKLFRG